MHDDKLTYGKIYGQEKNSPSAIARMNLFCITRDFKCSGRYPALPELDVALKTFDRSQILRYQELGL